MCLFILVEAPANTRERLAAAADSASQDGLRVEIARQSRWPWARCRSATAVITEEDGCACSLLNDAASWNAETWLMRADIVDRLGETLRTLAVEGPPRLTIAALWIGDKPLTDIVLTPEELERTVRTTGLRQKTRYIVSGESPSRLCQSGAATHRGW